MPYRRREFLKVAAAFAGAGFAQNHSKRRANVLLLVASEWRAQSMPGDDSDLRAPNLQRLARESARFDRAYTACPLAGPSRTALMTGCFPHAASEPSIAQQFNASGYRTGSLGTASQAIEFIRQNKQNPFFLSVGLSTSSAGSKSAYEPATLHLRTNVPAEWEARARTALAAWYARFTAVDETVGGMLRTLDDQRLTDDTIVVFTSESGNMLGSHGLEGDGSFHEESVRVPLLVRGPRQLEAGPRDFLVSNVDIMPTLLGWCGIEIPERVQGRNLAALARAAAGFGDRPESIYAVGRDSEWRMIVRGLDKLVVDSDLNITHLFNLGQDPFEMENLAQDASAELKRDELKAVLKDWMRRAGDRMDPSGLKRR